MLRLLLWVPLVIHAFAADPYCPAYAAPQRTAFLQSEAKLKAFRAFSAARARKGRFAYASAYGLTSDDNLIDRHIFGKMQTDGVDSGASVRRLRIRPPRLSRSHRPPAHRRSGRLPFSTTPIPTSAPP